MFDIIKEAWREDAMEFVAMLVQGFLLAAGAVALTILMFCL
jgi:hypothetical protein